MTDRRAPPTLGTYKQNYGALPTQNTLSKTANIHT